MVFLEQAPPVSQARSLYEYDRQTDEELSFPEDVELSVYDTSDPDWVLVGFKDEYGFAPANYIQLGGSASSARQTVYTPPETEPEQEEEDAPPPMPARPQSIESPPALPSPVTSGPAANIASIMASKPQYQPAQVAAPEPASPALPTRRVQFTPEPSDEEPPAPTMPTRPQVSTSPPPPARDPSPLRRHVSTVMESPPIRTPSTRSPQIQSTTFDNLDGRAASNPTGSYHLYNISEMVSVMGKQKKMPVTLGINMATGMIMLSPEKKRDGPEQEWTADKLEHYSLEGKHVFLELKKPSKSLDLHAGAKDTAHEIVAALGELAGAVRLGGGLDQIIEASQGRTGPKRGHMLYEFMAQGDDEVTVAEGDEVIVVDDFTSDEWWKVRRLKNNKEGVVPSSYVEISADPPAPPPKDISTSGLNAGRSTVEQNRREEERATRESIGRDQDKRRSTAEVSSRMSFLRSEYEPTIGKGSNTLQQRTKRDSGTGSSRDKAKSSKYKTTSRLNSPTDLKEPDMSKVRTWTDRSGSFKVEAQFIGLRDGKIHLHKTNGVKIAVPVDRMATADINYVEKVTGRSLDDDKPLSEITKRNSRQKGRSQMGQAGASIEPRPEYDWFEFFLSCGVNPHQCERYAQAFSRDQMDESNQEDITKELLRTLGLREGDILKVMKTLDKKFDRKTKSVGFSEGSEASNGDGLFSGPGGSLKNNTSKGRPAPPVQTNNTVDADAFKVDGKKKGPTPPEKGDGFEDDAWNPKPARAEPKPVETPKSPPPAAEAIAPAPAQPKPAPPHADLIHLLDTPLQPVVQHQTGPALPASATPPAPPQGTQPAQPVQPQPTGATPGFFQQLPPQQTGLPQQLQQQTMNQQQPLMQQQTGYAPQMNAQQPQPLQAQPTALNGPLTLGGARQRPAPPVQPQFTQNALMPPPPARPGSAPQQVSQQNGFGPPNALMPQLTGAPGPTFNPAANPGQSLVDMQRSRIQQQMTAQPLQPMQTGYQGQIMPQQTGYLQNQLNISPFADSNRVQSPPQMQGFTAPPMQPQMTGYQPQLQPQPTGMMQPMQPQQTGFGQAPMQPQPTGMNVFGGGGYAPPPPVPQIPQQFQNVGQSAPFQPQSQFGQHQQAQNTGIGGGLQALAQPLVPQKTGPPPPVSFGLGAKKLTAQPTGRANLSKATASNPFGFE